MYRTKIIRPHLCYHQGNKSPSLDNSIQVADDAMEHEIYVGYMPFNVTFSMDDVSTRLRVLDRHFSGTLS